MMGTSGFWMAKNALPGPCQHNLTPSGITLVAQALLLFFPQPLLRELKEQCAAALADLLAVCPGQNLATKGARHHLYLTLI